MIFAATIAALACAAAQEPPPPPLPPGIWRATLASPGGELPFGVEVDAEGVAQLVNGSEQIAVPELRLEDGRVVLDMPHFDSRIEAVLADDGTHLTGTWSKHALGEDRWTRMGFEARAGVEERFFRETRDRAQLHGGVAGRWRVRFASSDEDAVGVFEDGPGGTVEGTFLTTTGDLRFLAGRYEGDRLRLSCFDGAHAFLFDARLDEDGVLAGDFWSRDTWHETWSATRAPEAALPDAFAQTRWSEGASLADLVFGDLEGRVRSVPAILYGSRAAIVQVFGSWYPNCHDETRLLVELHERYRERGLAIVGLAFELTGDPERDTAQVKRYAERFGIGYELLLAGVADKALASAALPELDRVRAFPTTIFLDSGGKVRRVHTGFAGPATGAAHAEVRAEFEGLIEELLSEPPDDGAETWAWLESRKWKGVGTPDVAFVVRDGKRLALRGDETLAPRLIGDALFVGSELWRVERETGILVDPRDFGRRQLSVSESGEPLTRSGAVALDPEWWTTWGPGPSAPIDFGEDPVWRRDYVVGLPLMLDFMTQSGAALPRPEGVEEIRDPDIRVRIAEAWVAGRASDEAALPGLIEATHHANAALRTEVARALGHWRDRPEVAAALEQLARDLDPVVRQVAARSLGR